MARKMLIRKHNHRKFHLEAGKSRSGDLGLRPILQVMDAFVQKPESLEIT